MESSTTLFVLAHRSYDSWTGSANESHSFEAEYTGSIAQSSLLLF